MAFNDSTPRGNLSSLWFPKLAKRFGNPAVQRNSVSRGASLDNFGRSNESANSAVFGNGVSRLRQRSQSAPLTLGTRVGRAHRAADTTRLWPRTSSIFFS